MKHRDDKGHYEWQKITDCVPLLGPSQVWHHHLSTTTHQGHESFYAAHTTSSSRLELCILWASFIKAKTNLPWCVPSGVIDVTPQAQGQAEMKTEKELGQMMNEDELNADTEVVAFFLPCFVKWFLPAELFPQYQSKRDHTEKTKIACIPRVPRVTLAYSSRSKSIHLLPFQ